MIYQHPAALRLRALSTNLNPRTTFPLAYCNLGQIVHEPGQKQQVCRRHNIYTPFVF